MITLPDNHNKLFGREEDIQHLLARTPRNGVTIITGRPMLGKTWLLLEVARHLLERDYLVGYVEAGGETDDLFLRVIADAYERWLSKASFRQQAVSIWERKKGDFITDVGRAVGEIFEAVAEKPAGKMVNKVFRYLAQANDELRTGGVELKQLGFEQGKELIDLMSTVSGKSIVLILDALDRTPFFALELNKIESFLSHIEDWSPCHILVGLRSTAEMLRSVEKLCDRALEATQYPLKTLDTNNAEVASAMMNELILAVPAARRVSKQVLLTWIDGYPGVLNRWRKIKPTKEEELKFLADDAHEYRYEELKDRIPQLTTDELQLAIRLALLPRLSRVGWDHYKDLLLSDNMKEELIDTLYTKGILEGDDGTNYGHETRQEAIRRWLLEPKNRYRQHVRREMETLAYRLAARIHGIDSSYDPYTSLLRTMLPLALKIDAQPDVVSLTMAAVALFLDRTELHLQVLLLGAFRAVEKEPQTSDLMAMALANSALVVPKEQPELQKSIIIELMNLDGIVPSSVIIGESLARALYGTMRVGAQDDDVPYFTATLGLLRELKQRYPSSDLITEQVAKALSICVHVLNVRDSSQADGFLDELRDLGANLPEDEIISNCLAKALFNASNPRNATADHLRQNNLLQELRQLNRKFPQYIEVARTLGKRLVHVLDNTNVAQNINNLEILLDELRALRENYDDDVPISEVLSAALFIILKHKKDQLTPQYLADIRNELRTLCEELGDHPVAQEVLGMLAADTF